MMDPAQLTALLKEHGLVVEQKDGWLRLYLQQGRQRGMALVTSLMGAGTLLASALLPDHESVTAAIRFALGAFGVSLLTLALYLPFNALDVRISRRKMKRVRTWFGLTIRSREIDLDDLEALDIDRRTAAAGSPIAICYELVGRGPFGRFKLVESIPDRSLIEAVRTQVMVAAGRRPSPMH